MTDSVKKIIFIILFFIMFFTTIWAGNQQNLLTDFSWNGSSMWFKATLVDFYINQLILWFWVVSLESKNWIRLIWLILFICFGSMGTTAYILFRLFSKKSLFKKESI